MTVRDALNSAMDEEMAKDDTVYVLGEEVRWQGGNQGAPPGSTRCACARAPRSRRAPRPLQPLCSPTCSPQVGEYQGAYKVSSGAV